jgi:ribonuclease R
VILDRILAQERRLQFSIVEEGMPLTGSQSAKPPKPKKNKQKRPALPGAKTKKKRFVKKGKRR